MKKLVVFMSTVLLLVGYSSSQAQSNINIGLQPAWGPTGFDYVDYYYLPDIESYYDVNKRQYVYNNAGTWVSTNKLPAKYANYDMYKGYKVVLNEPTPFMHFNDDKVKYAKFKGYKEHQDFIKNSNDPKYYIVKGHPKYSANNKFGNKHDDVLGKQNNGNGYKNDNGKIKNNKSDNDDDRDNKSVKGKIKNNKSDNDDDRDNKSGKGKMKNIKSDVDDDRDNKSGEGKIKNNKSDNDDDRDNKLGEGKIKNNKSDDDDDRNNKSGKDKMKKNKSDNDDDRENKSGEGKIKNNKPDNDDARENRSDNRRNKQMGNKGKGNKKD